MEIECVVCGSQNDQRTLRCFVCGAELPPSEALDHRFDAVHHTPSLQSIHPSVKTPLSVGALALEEILSQRPSPSELDEQQLSSPQIDLLLEPEDLSPLSSNFAELESKKIYDLYDEINAKQSLSVSLDDLSLSEAIPDVEGVFDVESQPRESTWIGVPLPDSLVEQVSPSDSSKPSNSSNANEVEEALLSVKTPSQLAVSDILKRHQRIEQEQRADFSSIKKQDLTGDELKQLEADILPDPWTPVDQIASQYKPVQPEESHAPLVVSEPIDQDDEESNEPDTALRVSIPDLAELHDQDQPALKTSEAKPSLNDGFVPVSTLAHSQTVPHSDRSETLVVENEESPDEVQSSVHEANIENLSPLPTTVAIEQDIQEPTSIEQASEATVKLASNSVAFGYELAQESSVKSSMSLGSWLLLALASLSVGVVIALYFLPNDQAEIETRIKVSQVTQSEAQYQVSLDLFAQPNAQLIIPDSYVGEGQKTMHRVQGKAKVDLTVPETQMKLGANRIVLQWAYYSGNDQQQRFSPVEIILNMDYQQGEVEYSKDRQAYLLNLELRPGLNLVKSNYEFELAEKAQHYRFIVPKEQLGKNHRIEVKASLKDPLKKEVSHEVRLNYQSIYSSEPLVILSPVQRYARPEKELIIRGRASPNADLSIKSVYQNNTRVELDVSLQKVKANGSFEFKLNLPQFSKKKDGDEWRVELEATDLQGLTQQQQIEFKQSHGPTWQHYVKRLTSRRERAETRYRKFIHRKIVKQPKDYLGKAGIVKGVILFIDRGNEQQAQRFLINSCETQSCPMWIEDKDAFWVKIGQEVSIFGVFLGLKSYLNAEAQMQEAPEFRSRLTTP